MSDWIRNRISFKPWLVLFFLGLILLPNSALGQATGGTNLDITLPDIVILHYFSTVSITLDSSDLADLYNTTADQGSATGDAFSVDLAIDPVAATETVDSAVLTLQNAWAVRALNASDVQLELTLTASTLTAAGSGEIDITSGTVSTSGVTAAATIQFPAPGMKTPTKGDVNLTLDFSSATEDGQYSGAVYTLTASNL